MFIFFFFAFCTEWKAFGSGLLKSYFHLYSYWLAFVLPSLVYRFALVTSLGIANLFYPFSLKIEHHVRSILAPGDYFFSLSIFLLLLLSFFKWFFILCMCVSGFCDAILNIECDSGSFKKLKWFWSFIFFFSVLTIDQLFDILKRRERCERKPNERIRKKRKNLILWSRLENNDRIKRTMNVFFLHWLWSRNRELVPDKHHGLWIRFQTFYFFLHNFFSFLFKITPKNETILYSIYSSKNYILNLYKTFD